MVKIILMLDEGRSNLKKNTFCFVIVYYRQHELDYIKRLPQVEELEHGKYRFKVSYIDFVRIIKEWKKIPERISIDADDIPKIFGIYSIKRKEEYEKRDREKYL
jgi:hypothetical protein